MIGLMFGPVIWFALLMSTLLMGCYVPERWLAAPSGARHRRLEQSLKTCGPFV